MVKGVEKVVDSGAVLGGNDVPEAWRTGYGDGMALKQLVIRGHGWFWIGRTAIDHAKRFTIRLMCTSDSSSDA